MRFRHGYNLVSNKALVKTNRLSTLLYMMPTSMRPERCPLHWPPRATTRPRGVILVHACAHAHRVTNHAMATLAFPGPVSSPSSSPVSPTHVLQMVASTSSSHRSPTQLFWGTRCRQMSSCRSFLFTTGGMTHIGLSTSLTWLTGHTPPHLLGCVSYNQTS
jgi:hypothetical protein